MNSIGTVSKALTWIATFAVMFGGAVQVGPGSLRRLRDQPGLFMRTLLAVWILVPVLTIVVVLAFGVRGLPATMLLLMAICPGYPLLITAKHAVRGSIATALLALLLTTATEPVLIPYWTRLLTVFHPLDLRVQTGHVLGVLVPTVFVPILLGFIVRAISLRLGLVLARLCGFVYLGGVAITIVVDGLLGLPLLRHAPPHAFVAAIVITFGDAVIGYWVARPNKEDQKALALSTAMGNPALALAVVEVIFPAHEATGLVAAYLTVRALALLPIQWWLKRGTDTTAAAHPSVRGRPRHA